MSSMLPSRCVQTVKAHNGPVLAAQFDAKGEYCLSGGQDKLVHLWNTSQLLTAPSPPIQTYSGHSWEVLDIAIAKDNATFASCGGDKAVFLWDVSSGRILRKFQGHFHKINTVDFNEEGSVVASGSYDRSVRLWDCRSSARFPLQIMEEAKDSISSLHLNGTSIITGSVDGHTRQYDIRQGRMLDDNISHPVTSVRYSMDNACYLASCLDDMVRLFDAVSGELLNDFGSHKNSKYRIKNAFSHDEAWVIGGSEDGLIYIWDLMTTNVTKTLSGHTAAISAVMPHPKEHRLLSASLDGTLRLWV